MTEPGILTLNQYLPYSPSMVWRALTEPDLLVKWWAAGDIKPLVGHRFTLDMGKFGLQSCEVIAVEHEYLLKYTFAPGRLNTTITWILKPESEGTLLTLEHKGFDLDSPLGKQAFHGMGNGWPAILGRIEKALA